MSSSIYQDDHPTVGTARSLANTNWTIAGCAACDECVVSFGGNAQSPPYSGTMNGQPILWDEDLTASPPQFVILANSPALWPNLTWTGTWGNGTGAATLSSWTQNTGTACTAVTVVMTQAV